jgi:superfamily II DNA or RNA helicase
LPIALSRSLIKIKNKDFDLEESVQSLEDAGINGDAISEYTKRCPNKPAIVFCCNIRHAKQMADRFIKAGYKAAALVSKGVGPLERAQMIEDLGNGNLDVITSIDIISEGTDIPVVTTAILLRPTESLTIYLQQVGRVLRPAPDKEFAFIIDCVGNVQKHGMPQQDRDWSLEGTPKKDKSPSVFTCQSCYAVFERESSEWPVICPYCGHEHWPEEKPQEKPNVVLNVDLVEVEENENITTQHDRRKLIAKATCLEDFIEIGKLMGYKPGWAHIAWKERKAKISQAEWKPPAKPVKYHKFNMSEIMKQAGIPEPPWGK